MELTRRQREVLGFIEGFVEKRGYPPTLREIGQSLGIKSTNAVSDHLSVLERKGVIVRDRTRSRGIVLPAKRRASGIAREGVVDVPVLGRIAAGAPLLAEENLDGYVRVDERYVSGRSPHFALRVVGESMIEAGILDGDLVIVRSQNEAKQGEIVVALVDGSATVKRFYLEGDRVRLQPANAQMEPIYISKEEARETLVQGVVVGVLRRLGG